MGHHYRFGSWQSPCGKPHSPATAPQWRTGYLQRQMVVAIDVQATEMRKLPYCGTLVAHIGEEATDSVGSARCPSEENKIRSNVAWQTVEQPKANRGLQQLSEARVDMVDIFNVGRWQRCPPARSPDSCGQRLYGDGLIAAMQ
jgi:hypothetical protein